MVPKEACEERAQRHEKVSGWICFGEEREEEEDDWRLHVDEIVCGAVGRGGRLTPCLGVFQWWTSENGEEAGEEGTWREWARFEGAFVWEEDGNGEKMIATALWEPSWAWGPRRSEWRLRLGCVGVGRITWSKEMKGLRKVWGSDRYWGPELLGRDA